MKLWLEELSLFQQSYSYKEQTSDYLLDVDKLSDSDLPIWLAAQKAVTRYEGLLSPVGPRGRLLRKLLTWSGLIPSTTETTFELQNDNTASELYLGFVLMKLYPFCFLCWLLVIDLLPWLIDSWKRVAWVLFKASCAMKGVP